MPLAALVRLATSPFPRVLLCLLTLFVLPLAALGCGAGPTAGVVLRDAEPLPDGEAIYRVRYNPPPCLPDLPELHVELETGAGWERVALESGADESDLVQALLTRFERAPQAVVPVMGNLTNRARTWAGQHASRVFVVQIVDPPLEPAEPPAG